MIFIILAAAVVFIALFILYVYWDNNSINVKTFTVRSERLPQGFDGYVIAHISDLHNKLYKNDNEQLLNKIKKLDTDIILITGDAINGTEGLIDNAVHFIKQAVDIAPVYFTPGNHEAKKENVYADFIEKASDTQRLTLLVDKKT